jgi:hypothetical protein
VRWRNSTASTSDKYRDETPACPGFFISAYTLVLLKIKERKDAITIRTEYSASYIDLTSGLTIRHHPVFVVNQKYACLC